jgi:IclR family acetate operon transcriptional repressor
MTQAKSQEERVFGTQTISRALSALGVLRRASGDIGVSEMARELSLHTSTTHRLLKALVAEGYAAQNPATDKYRLGREAFLLGLAAERNLGLAELTPVLQNLRDVTGESVNLVVSDGTEGLVVLRVESDHPLRFTQDVGTRIPLHSTSTGKVLLAFADDPVKAVESLGPLTSTTESTLTERDALVADLERVRERGYAVNRGERFPGVCGVAAPVRDASGAVLAALAAQGPEVRMGPDRVQELADAVIGTAGEVGELLPAGFRF